MNQLGGWPALSQAVRRRPVVWAAIVVIIVAVAGVCAAALSGGSSQATAAKAKPEPGVITADDMSRPLNAKVLAVAREVLAGARARNRTALDRLLIPAAPAPLGAAALNQVLAQPGTYTQIIAVLTRTHGASLDGFTIWPGFVLAGTSGTGNAADAKVLGIGDGQQYPGISITIGASGTGHSYVPRLVSITHNVP